MSNQDNSDALLDALRRVGVVIPKLEPIKVRSVVEKKTSILDASWWIVSNGAMSTVIDPRDASNEEEAIRVARTDSLQAWHINGHLADAITVKQVSRNEYIDWLRSHD
jgi:hypothetical protein